MLKTVRFVLFVYGIVVVGVVVVHIVCCCLFLLLLLRMANYAMELHIVSPENTYYSIATFYERLCIEEDMYK